MHLENIIISYRRNTILYNSIIAILLILAYSAITKRGRYSFIAIALIIAYALKNIPSKYREEKLSGKSYKYRIFQLILIPIQICIFIFFLLGLLIIRFILIPFLGIGMLFEIIFFIILGLFIIGYLKYGLLRKK